MHLGFLMEHQKMSKFKPGKYVCVLFSNNLPVVVLEQGHDGLCLFPNVDPLIFVLLQMLKVFQGLDRINVFLALLSNLKHMFKL